MAHDAAVAGALRAALADTPGIDERRMVGALCFMLRGDMLCGALADGGFFRVGRPGEAAAPALPGAARMAMRTRPMPGLVRVPPATVADPALRGELLALAGAFVEGLPAAPRRL